MRSFKLWRSKIVFFGLMLFSLTTLAQNDDELFSVTLNAAELQAPIKPKLSQKALKTYSAQALDRLIVRLTGRVLPPEQLELLKPRAASWLKSYKLIPNVIDGVKIDDNLRLNYREDSINKMLSAEGLSLWAMGLRPKLLMMGTLVENGHVVRLSDQTLSYRVDYPLALLSEPFALPHRFADETQGWVLPVAAQTQAALIQQLLISGKEQNLLAFKFIKESDNPWRTLEWRLYDNSALEVASSVLQGKNERELYQQMLMQVAANLVEQQQQTLSTTSQVVLTIEGVHSAEQLLDLQTQLVEQIPVIESLELFALSGQNAQFQVQSKGALDTIHQWLQRSNLITQPVLDVSNQVIRAQVAVASYENTATETLNAKAIEAVQTQPVESIDSSISKPTDVPLDAPVIVPLPSAPPLPQSSPVVQ